MTVITFDDSDEDLALLRAITHKVLEQSAGDYFSPWHFLEDVELDVSDFDLATLATDEIEIISGMWGQSRTSGFDKYVAYSLGKGTWYIVHTLASDETMLDSVVADDDRDDAFRTVARQWCQESMFSFPTEFSSMFGTEPWFLREMSDAISGNEGTVVDGINADLSQGPPYGDGAVLRIQSIFWDVVEDASDTWNTTESVPGMQGSTDDLPPEFETWFQRVELRWVDTGEPLDLPQANRLRLACQCLGLAN